MALQVGKKYRVSSGSTEVQNDFCLGVDVTTNEYVSVRFEPLNTIHPTLFNEVSVYKSLEDARGFPVVRYRGTERNWNVSVLDGLGPSLEELFNYCDRKFSLKTVLLIAMQLLERLEHMHGRGYIHRDIDPANFMIGFEEAENTIHVTGFRYAKPYVAHGEHIQYKVSRKLVGNARFASLSAHLGCEQTRRDDVESLGYVLVYLLLGGLPWQGLPAKNKLHKYEQIAQMKARMSPKELCAGLPPAFQEYLSYCRQMPFDAKPNYRYLYELFHRLFQLFKFEYDNQFDWVVKRNLECKTNNSTEE
eukprot:Rmarinus@m.10349